MFSASLPHSGPGLLLWAQGILFPRVAGCLLICACLLASCTGTRTEGPRGLVATIPPLGAILREIAGERLPVTVLLKLNASPHTYDPRPSDARLTENALAMFYVAETLDGWAADLPAARRVEVLELVPHEFLLEFSEAAAEMEADHGHAHTEDGASHNPHFWTDPVTVHALVPALVQALSELDPDGAAAYARNGADFQARLTALHATLAQEFQPHAGAAVALFHPSWDYFLERHGLIAAAYVEPNPGREVSPQHLKRTIALLKSENVRAIFTEPQLSRRPAEVVADAANLPLYELDPLGGGAGRASYEGFIRHNAAVLKKALQ